MVVKGAVDTNVCIVFGKTKRRFDTIESVKAIFEELQSVSSKTGKELILENNSDNPLFKYVLHYILNPYITTGLSEKKISRNVDGIAPTKVFENAREVMEYLQENKTGTDEIISNVRGFLNSHPTMSDFYKSIFTKSVKLGCAATTANKVYGKDFVPQFECMLAEKYYEHMEKVEGKDFTITLKLDGIRCFVVKEGFNIALYSRQGQLIEGLVDIEYELLNSFRHSFILDGELLVTNTQGMTSKEQYKATTKIVRKDGNKCGITFRAFDCITPEEYHTQNCDRAYTERRNVLERDFGNLEFVKVLPVLYSGNDISQINLLLDKVRADGQEGLMININFAPYEFKRTQNLLKVKVMSDCDLRIIGFEEGRGRLSGTLGRINVDYKGNTLGVGSGFNDAQREFFWNHRDELLGRVVTVQYFEETKDKSDKLSLRFPIFKELRDDGKEVSYA